LGDIGIVLRSIVITLCIWPSLVSAQTYLVEPSLLACQIRSAQQCAALNCDGGILQGSISGTTLTVTKLSKTPNTPNSRLSDATGLVAPGTQISGPCAVVAGTGTCPVNISQTVSSEIMSFGQSAMWWGCQVLSTATSSGGAGGSGGTTAIIIEPGDGYYDVTTTNQVATSPTGLTSTEQSAIQTQAALGAALPYMIPQPTWKAIFTAGEIASINASATLKAEMAAILATNPINLNSAAVQSFLSAALSGGEITQATYTAATAYQATIGNP
jgi:hypothetical protein